MSSNALDLLVADCVEALARVGNLFASDASGRALFARLGWQVDAVPPPLVELAQHLRELGPLLQQAQAQPDSIDLWTSLAEKVPQLVREIRDLEHKSFGATLDAAGFAEKFTEQLLEWAAIEQLDRRHARVLAVLRALGIVRAIHHDEADGRPAFVEERFVCPDFSATFTSPSTLLRTAWAWGDPAFDGTGLLDQLIALFQTLGWPAGYVTVAPSPRELTEVELGALRWHVVTRFLSGNNGGAAYEAGLRLLTLKEGSDPAIAVIPYVEGTLTEAIELTDEVAIAIKGAATAGEGQGLLISPATVRFVKNLLGESSSNVAADLSATLSCKHPAPVETKIGPLVVQSSGWSIQAAAHATDSGDDTELTLEASLKDAQIGFKVEDGFLASLFGTSQTTIPVPLVVGLSSRRGVYISASGLKFETQVSLHFGAVEVRGIQLKLDGIDRGVSASIATTFVTNLGPINLAVEGLGTKLNLSFPKENGNFGPLAIDAGLVPPTGAGVSIDAAAVVGAGFLSIDTQKGQYSGFVQLTISDYISVTAIGILSTKLPDGSKGFSLVVMITAEGFNPIQLGLGFTLTAIGGLLAINRTVNEDFLREGIKNQTLNSILFPKDPLRNAVQIFGVLNNAFPPRIGSYLFGPVVRICWGTPALITMDLALVLEIGKRTRLIILGRLSAIMPSEKQDLLRLQMNALGVIDFDQGSVSLDAVLFDSRLSGKFPITGGMAMRLRWGSDPIFALSIGGFHPAFKPPPNFPVLDRLAISFSNTADFRLRAECYVAITSNTLQFGAKVELFARAGGFSIEGRVGFDVLIQFDPFMFLADFEASVQLKRGSHNLFKVKVEGELSGPRPLHIKGKATFEILWWDFSVHFDRTLISGEKPPNLEPINVTERLVASLTDSRNWSGQLPNNVRRLVTLREPQGAGVIVFHPLGTLGVKQNVAPLDLEISRFGNATPAGDRLFKINSFTVTGKEVTFTKVQDFFPPSQFLELSDEEKLSAPSFELLNAGVSAGVSGFVFSTKTDDVIETKIEYETFIIDGKPQAETNNSRTTIGIDFFSRHLSLGAAGRSSLRRTGNTKYRTTQVNKYSLGKKGWTIESTADGSPAGAPDFAAGTVGSYTEAFQAVQKLKSTNPAQAKKLRLARVPVESVERNG